MYSVLFDSGHCSSIAEGSGATGSTEVLTRLLDVVGTLELDSGNGGLLEVKSGAGAVCAATKQARPAVTAAIRRPTMMVSQ